ncbi:YigZ family protein [Winogradskyella sp.]|uniref:IMPACT family protein n=1 Tax=Winogradskyella sp. TaxID=1883156 RepID=UPI002603E0BF|nr:YigZ family protein [Winogradskyella sp.]
MLEKDTFKTISKPAQGDIYKDKNSKFYGYSFPVTNENDIKNHLETLRKEHHSARHWCYAYQIGTETISYRTNDDGEPSNSAGIPIYGQIQAFEVTNILIVVVRYYGGTKLGVRGLINAYRTSAKLALESADIIKETINLLFRLNFKYKDMGKVMRILKENRVNIINQKLEHDCVLEISVRKGDGSKILQYFKDSFGIEIDEL